MSEPRLEAFTPEEEASVREQFGSFAPDSLGADEQIIVCLLATLDEVRSAHSLPVGDDSPSLDALREAVTLAAWGYDFSSPIDAGRVGRDLAPKIARHLAARLSKEDTDDRP